MALFLNRDILLEIEAFRRLVPKLFTLSLSEAEYLG